jgi:acyl-CoA synthetase (AMP-forming)/AMP-acid ligase II
MFTKLERHASSARGVHDAQLGEFCPYPELLERVAKVSESLASPSKGLVLLLCDNTMGSLVAYLAAVRSGHAVMLASCAIERSFVRKYLDAYRPDWLFCPSLGDAPPEGYVCTGEFSGMSSCLAGNPTDEPVHPDLALLLLTSGSTGSPKAVRLSYANLDSNARSICEYLRLDESETAITTLPMSYSYGMSVINSHLEVGANLVLTNHSVATAAFWDLIRARKCTSLAGVPFTYEVLERLRFQNLDLPSLRVMTQAGGRLPDHRTEVFAQWAQQRGLRFYVMYGQTEASPRIAYVPPDRLLQKIGSIGIAIPGGRLGLESLGEPDSHRGPSGELVYEGPNVMLGYADSRSCLSKGDEMRGRLQTGDVGLRDDEGFFYITGRLKRFLKLFGLRINLDELEHLVESFLGNSVACIGSDDLLKIVVASYEPPDAAALKRHVAQACGLHASAIRVCHTETLPIAESGKKDYAAIHKQFA